MCYQQKKGQQVVRWNPVHEEFAANLVLGRRGVTAQGHVAMESSVSTK